MQILRTFRKAGLKVFATRSESTDIPLRYELDEAAGDRLVASQDRCENLPYRDGRVKGVRCCPPL